MYAFPSSTAQHWPLLCFGCKTAYHWDLRPDSAVRQERILPCHMSAPQHFEYQEGDHSISSASQGVTKQSVDSQTVDVLEHIRNLCGSWMPVWVSQIHNLCGSWMPDWVSHHEVCDHYPCDRADSKTAMTFPWSVLYLGHILTICITAVQPENADLETTTRQQIPARYGQQAIFQRLSRCT